MTEVSPAEVQMQEANALFRDGLFLKAAGAYTKAAKTDPDNATIQCNLCYALLKVNKFRQAVKAAERCIELDPDSYKGHFRYGLALLGTDEYESAIAALALAASKSPANSPAQREAESCLAKAKWSCKLAFEAKKEEVPACAADAKDPATDKENLTPKEKMAMKQAKNRQNRLRKHVTTQMRKALSENEGVKELEETPIGPGQKVATNASELSADQIAALSTEKDVLDAKKRLMEGERLPYDAERVARFAKSELECIADSSKRSAYVHPIAIFLPGVKKDGWGDQGSGVGIRGAFDTQKTYARVPTFLRDWATKTVAHAVMIVMPKSQIAFPTIWKGDDKWPVDDAADGYIVQLETPDADSRQAWFIKLTATGNTVSHELDPLRQCVLPPVFQKIAAAKGGAKGKPRKGKKKGGIRS